MQPDTAPSAIPSLSTQSQLQQDGAPTAIPALVSFQRASRWSLPTLSSPPTSPRVDPPSPLAVEQHFYPLVFLALLVLVMDIVQLGVDGETNTRLLSLVDSYAHCASWISAGDNVQLHFVFSVLTKYGGGTLIALLLHVTPTVLSGWTHNITFLTALLLAHAFPRVSRAARSRRGPWRVFFVLQGAVFKSRKMRFAIRNAAALGGPEFVLLIGILSMELTAWLAWGCRRRLKGLSFFGKPKAIAQTVFHPRTLLSLLATWAAWTEQHPLILIAVLVVHKATKPSSESVVY